MRSFRAVWIGVALFAVLVPAATVEWTAEKTSRPPSLERQTAAPETTTTTTLLEPEPVTTTTTTSPQPTTSVAPTRTGRCGDDFDCFKACTGPIESGGDYTINTGNGHYGFWQFAHGTWVGAVERAGYPEWADRTADQAPPHVQDAAAHQLWSERGTAPWGSRCS